MNVEDDTVVQPPLNELRLDPYQPRRTFKEVSLQELASSIEQSGVFQPIIVHHSAAKEYGVIAGGRCFQASRLAEKKTILVIVRDFDEKATMQVAVLENLRREGLSPLEGTEAYEILIKNLKPTQAEAVSRLERSRLCIANYLRLFSLPNPVKEMVQDQRLPMGQARTLLGLENKILTLKLANCAVIESLAVRQLERPAPELGQDDGKEKKKIPRLVKEKPYYIRESEDRLMDKFGTGVAIQEKNGKDKTEIEYLSRKDLTRVLDILNIQSDEE